jgi:FixJ family two-component response regulator
LELVDDDPGMLKVTEDLLGAHGFMTTLFASAEEFLASGGANEADCLLLDIQARQLMDAIEKAWPARTEATSPIQLALKSVF